MEKRKGLQEEEFREKEDVEVKDAEEEEGTRKIEERRQTRMDGWREEEVMKHVKEKFWFLLNQMLKFEAVKLRKLWISLRWRSTPDQT